MKTKVAVTILLICMPLFAQHETLIHGSIESGGFGGISLKTTQVNDDLVLLVGGGGGWIINHTLFLGGAGYGLVNKTKVPDADPEKPPYLSLGYGGLWFGYIHNSSKLVHTKFHTLIGAGGLNYTYWKENQREMEEIPWESDSFFIIEPGVDVVLNMTENFRVSAGATYRFVMDISFPGYTDESIGGPSVCISFKFGDF